MSIHAEKDRDDAAQAAAVFLERIEAFNKAGGYAPKESGAVRRASMELTRALAQLRRYS